MGAREAITKLLMGKVGGPWEGGIRAYHSSPHDFDRFDWSKLRTGEGANTYGAGFYAAENPAVSGQGGQYWDQFLNRFSGPERDIAERLRAANFDRKAAAGNIDEERAWLEYNVKHANSPEAAAKHAKMLDALRALEGGAPVGPRTYEVNINARPELMLDWDKPLTQQSQLVQDYLTKGPLRGESLPTDTGQRSYQRLTGHDPEMKTYASEELRAAGIPGIRYLDQGSRINPEKRALEMQLQTVKSLQAQSSTPGYLADRATRLQGQIEAFPPPSYNYVVTDPSKLDILAKYGVVGTAGGGMGALAAQDQYGAQP